MDKNKIVDMIERQQRWYYRIPALIAVAGVLLSIIALFKSEFFIFKFGVLLFFVGLGCQCAIGFEYFNWRKGKKQ